MVEKLATSPSKISVNKSVPRRSVGGKIGKFLGEKKTLRHALGKN